MSQDQITEIIFTVALPALVWLLWQLDNRIQSLEHRIKNLDMDSQRRSITNGRAIAQISAFLEKNYKFTCRYHDKDGSQCWPTEDPPSGFFEMED